LNRRLPTTHYDSFDDDLAEIREDYGAVSLAAFTVNTLPDTNQTFCAVGADGERVRGTGLPVDPIYGRWQIGSCTKSITAVLIAMLIEESERSSTTTMTNTRPIRWTSTLEQELSGTLLEEYTPASPYRNVTLEQLLSMAAGLPRDAPDWESYGDTGLPLTEQCLLVARDALQAKPKYPPGTTFFYSNWGYVLAGAILEVHTGELWEDLVATRIFQPLGIKLDTSLDFGVPHGDTDAWGHGSNLLLHYQPCNPYRGLCGIPRVMGPCGGFTGTSRAMAAYLSWHAQCHNGQIDPGQRDARILSQASCQRLHTPRNTALSNYALGWQCVERE
jgi:CubicO group peptidase (beta-lactamase class C family)